MGRSDQFVPQARKEDLVVQELGDEVLIYDLTRHKAHCLNRAAALVWEHCDGMSTVSAVARKVEEELATPSGKETVLYALAQLERFHLLEESATPTRSLVVPGQWSGMSRRDFLRKAGVTAAVAVPVIISLAAPTKAFAVSCVPAGGGCNISAECCPPAICVGNVCV